MPKKGKETEFRNEYSVIQLKDLSVTQLRATIRNMMVDDPDFDKAMQLWQSVKRSGTVLVVDAGDVTDAVFKEVACEAGYINTLVAASIDHDDNAAARDVTFYMSDGTNDTPFNLPYSYAHDDPVLPMGEIVNGIFSPITWTEGFFFGFEVAALNHAGGKKLTYSCTYIKEPIL